jgi:AcrR family transcriptional regulator
MSVQNKPSTPEAGNQDAAPGAQGSPATTPPKPGRGRPRAYDARQALAQATKAFWQAGYAATSLDDLSAATGMNRPSLYAAFGDKHALYLQLVERYAVAGQRAMQAALAPELPLRQGLMAVYETALAMYYPPGERPQGCFLVGTAVTAAGADDAVRARVAQGFAAFDHEFERRFVQAQQQGELGTGVDASTLARLASALLHTLAMRSRVGDTQAQLRTTAQAGVALLCGDGLPAVAKAPRAGKPGSTKHKA